MTKGKRKLL